jgi:UDP-GlcNAc3NAcA epimerase
VNKRIVTVVGARPQFIKAAPVSRAFQKRKCLEEILVHTGQHYDVAMSDIFFRELELSLPTYNLDVGSGSHAEQTGEIMKRLEVVLVDEKPDMLLIYGDTNSTLAGALVAAKLHIPVAHIEAGLRSFNRRMPEEINRIVADRLSSILFATTTTAVDNLSAEGITKGVHKTGDVMYDVALWAAEKVRREGNALSRLSLLKKNYLLATIHRAENTDSELRLKNIVAALVSLSRSYTIVLPLHPRTKKMLIQFNLLKQLAGAITLIDPVGFLDMVELESNAILIITDSGGVQKEAYFHRVPCVTLRDETEWVETVEAKWNFLADTTNSTHIVEQVNKSVSSAGAIEIKEYGDGASAEMIAGLLENSLAV